MLYFRAQNGKGKKTVVSDVELAKKGWHDPKLFTGLVDGRGTPIFEGDRLRIERKNWTVNCYGTVIYSVQKACFLLAGDDGENISNQPLGVYLAKRYAYIEEPK